MPKIKITTKSGITKTINFNSVPTNADIDEVSAQLEKQYGTSQAQAPVSYPQPTQQQSIAQQPDKNLISMAGEGMANTIKQSTQPIFENKAKRGEYLNPMDMLGLTASSIAEEVPRQIGNMGSAISKSIPRILYSGIEGLKNIGSAMAGKEYKPQTVNLPVVGKLQPIQQTQANIEENLSSRGVNPFVSSLLGMVGAAGETLLEGTSALGQTKALDNAVKSKMGLNYPKVGEVKRVESSQPTFKEKLYSKTLNQKPGDIDSEMRGENPILSRQMMEKNLPTKTNEIYNYTQKNIPIVKGRLNNTAQTVFGDEKIVSGQELSSYFGQAIKKAENTGIQYEVKELKRLQNLYKSKDLSANEAIQLAEELYDLAGKTNMANPNSQVDSSFKMINGFINKTLSQSKELAPLIEERKFLARVYEAIAPSARADWSGKGTKLTVDPFQLIRNVANSPTLTKKATGLNLNEKIIKRLEPFGKAESKIERKVLDILKRPVKVNNKVGLSMEDVTGNEFGYKKPSFNQANPVVGEVGDLTQEAGKVSKPVENALKKSQNFYDNGDYLTFKRGNTKIEFGRETLKNGDDSLFLQDIFTEPSAQGKGEASKLLKEITNYADKNGETISLRASIGGHDNISSGLNQKQLIKWYEKNGFVKSPNASNFGTDEIFMVREPSSIPKVSPLLQEARKYKSAEEFVKAQPTYYRGGRTLDISKIDEQGLPLTRDRNIAETFANEKNKLSESPIGKIINLDKSGIEEHYLNPSAKIAQKLDIPDDVYNAYKQANPLLNPDKAEPIINNWAKKNGFDAIDYSTLGKTSAKEAEVKVLNPDILKTKSQLTDIWEKAQGRSVLDILKSPIKR